MTSGHKTGVALAVGLAAALASCARPEAPAPLAKNEYVDARVCAQCHADIAHNYANTGMAKSFYPPDVAAIPHPKP
jgi:hypothetical protein